MKKYSLPILLAAFFITINSVFNIVNATNVITTKTVNVQAFNSLIIGGPIEVHLKIGNVNSYKLEGDKDAIASLVSEVKGNTLIIRPEVSFISWNKKYEGKKIVAHVTATEISALTLSGNSTLNVDGIIETESLALNLSGSGFIKLNAESNNLSATLSGTGTIHINGNAEKADITLSGKAQFNGENYEVDRLSTRMSGSGKIVITAQSNIKAIISGSASILYSGDPEIEKTIIGTGQIKKI